MNKRRHINEFFAAFHKIYDLAKALYMAMKLILNLRKVCIFLVCLRLLKESVLKHLNRSVYVHTIMQLCETCPNRF